ncbi:retrovirus-related pol polyprotein from transposon TNT 1-94 [Tanacetum coccineum]|uniref:Retrovirus-related pol polyprotein from transposon TNT 1-94 n=1 Tax=Tanacetum coccineum TaxID=301880 RepID=A0ABQ5AC03_9ASTR
MQDGDSDVEEDLSRNNEFIADLNAEYHERALLANQKRFYKRSRRVGSAIKPVDKSSEICFPCETQGHFQREYEESVSSNDEGVTKIKAFMAITDDELSVGKADARKHVLDYTYVDLYYVEDQRKNLLNKFNSLNQKLSSLPGNIIRSLGGRGKKKNTISSKEEPLPPLPKLLGVEPNDSSKDEISLAYLTLTPTVSKEIKKVFDKRSLVKLLKKANPITSSVPNLSLDKKYDSSTKKLLLTLMEEVKGLKEQIKISSDTSPSISQLGSTKSAKGKQKTWFEPCKHYGFRNHLLEDFYMKPKCSTCGSTDHLTKEHPEKADVRKTLAKLKARSHQDSSSRKAHMILKPFIDCKYCGFNDHHSDECEYYPGCDICGSIAHETAECTKKPVSNKRKPRIASQRFNEPIEKYSKESGPKVVFGDNFLGDTEGYGSVNCNGITYTKIAYGISLNFSSPFAPEQNGVVERRNKTLIEAAKTMLNSANLLKHFWGEVVNTACYTQNRSIIVKRHGKTAYDVFRGISLNISYFHVFGYLMHIHNHRDHLGKFDEKDDDGFFLGYSPVAKAFRVFNIKRQEMEESYHLTFSEDDEAISQASTKGDAVNFNENRSFPDDEFLEPRNKVTHSSSNVE